MSGSGADKVPPGHSDEEVLAKEGGKPEGPAAGTAGAKAGAAAGDAGLAAKAGAQAGGAPGGGGTGGPQGGGTPSPGTPPGGVGPVGAGGQAQGSLAVMPVFPFSASEKERQMIAAEAARVAAMLAHAQDAQKSFLQYLASQGTNGQYLVPTAEWVAKLLKVTDGLSPDDIEYLKQLDWKPGNVSEEELSERVRRALAHRKLPSEAGGAKPGPPSDEHEGGGGGRGSGRQQGRQPEPAASQTTGSAGSASAPGGGGRDRAMAPPQGVEHRQSGAFGFVILSGMTAKSNLRHGQEVRCSIRVAELDHDRRTFVLDDVSITFDSRKNSTTFTIYFTSDFWSDKYKFHGLGGKDTMNEYSFGKQPSKR